MMLRRVSMPLATGEECGSGDGAHVAHASVAPFALGDGSEGELEL